ncbi:hypothetical protein BRD00_11125 [Halobacteriales archaeon QS_8_69_26]|nr:MAG: hypothetical protein BRD00_11125 [Halobacteriales archaeon QS_8_69_26]
MIRDSGRGQANLAALAVALVVVTATAVAGVVVADGALERSDRDPEDRRVAVALSERIVSGSGPLANRTNVLDATAVEGFDAATLAERYPVVGDADVRVALDGETIAERGDPVGGTTVRRVVLVERRESVTLTPDLTDRSEVTLPRRTGSVEVRVDPPAGTTVRTVRANGRVVLHDPSGLDGTYEVNVSRFETTTLAVEASGNLPRGSVEVTYFPARTTKGLLEVTVDAE